MRRDRLTCCKCTRCKTVCDPFTFTTAVTFLINTFHHLALPILHTCRLRRKGHIPARWFCGTTEPPGPNEFEQFEGALRLAEIGPHEDAVVAEHGDELTLVVGSNERRLIERIDPIKLFVEVGVRR